MPEDREKLIREIMPRYDVGRGQAEDMLPFIVDPSYTGDAVEVPGDPDPADSNAGRSGEPEAQKPISGVAKVKPKTES